jgi:hypothetical protein
MESQTAVLVRVAILSRFVLTGCFSQSTLTASAAGRADNASSTSTRDVEDWSSTVAKPVTDPALNMTAYTVHVPAGWKFTGMMERIPGCHGTLVPADGLVVTAIAPDGVTAIEKLPGTSWGWSTDNTSWLTPKCGPVKIGTAAQYLLDIAIPNLRPDAKSIAVVPFTPEMKDGLARLNQQEQARAPRGMKTLIDAARVRLQYTLKGRPVEEIIWATVRCNEIDMPAYPMLHRAAVQRHTCSSPGIAIRRAPQGRLDPLIGKQLV